MTSSHNWHCTQEAGASPACFRETHEEGEPDFSPSVLSTQGISSFLFLPSSLSWVRAMVDAPDLIKSFGPRLWTAGSLRGDRQHGAHLAELGRGVRDQARLSLGLPAWSEPCVACKRGSALVQGSKERVEAESE